MQHLFFNLIDILKFTDDKRRRQPQEQTADCRSESIRTLELASLLSRIALFISQVGFTTSKLDLDTECAIGEMKEIPGNTA